ncbi:MAG: alkane 1-monooxygenase [Saprospiraceae bacterium]|nr:alkane 1-monooxygenase [Saprospiraceae bacterium]
MKFGGFKYLFVLTIPGVVLLSILLGGLWSYFALIFTFIFIPLLELYLKPSLKNISEAEEAIAQKDKFYDILLYLMVPIQYFTFFYFLTRIGNPNLMFFEKTGMTIAFGISCGVLGINAAHELGHRNSWHEQWMSKLLLLTSQYMHFFIEHNRGHHKNVATDLDPASGKYGENLYTFQIRSVKDGWISAWRLEGEKLKKDGRQFWSWHNEMLRFQIIQITFILGIYLIFGLVVLIFYLISAFIGISLLETVNYIEHYGLRRKEFQGKYERTMPVHSWNSNHPVGRLLLLELSRHSDHHFLANRKYQILRHFDESPQMPTGYPGMVLLSFFPPLWFKVMHKEIEKYRNRADGSFLA